MFFIAAGFYFVGNLLFVLLGKTDVQSWNSPETAFLKRLSSHVDAETPALLSNVDLKKATLDGELPAMLANGDVRKTALENGSKQPNGVV